MAEERKIHATGSPRGFASMDQDKQREIARKGGANVPNDKRSFAQNRALASEAGRKGGRSVAPQSRSFAQNRALAGCAARATGRVIGAATIRPAPPTVRSDGRARWVSPPWPAGRTPSLQGERPNAPWQDAKVGDPAMAGPRPPRAARLNGPRQPIGLTNRGPRCSGCGSASP